MSLGGNNDSCVDIHEFSKRFRRVAIEERTAGREKLFPENVAEHCFNSALLAHTFFQLYFIRRDKIDGLVHNLLVRDYLEKLPLLLMFHDLHESMSRDVPYGIKHASQEAESAHAVLESVGATQLFSTGIQDQCLSAELHLLNTNTKDELYPLV